SYTLSVNVVDIGTATTSASGTASVMDAALAGTGQSVIATEGSAFSGVVATFTDVNPAPPPTDFTATITWGDSATSLGTISGSAGSYAVSGTHTYATASTFSVSVAIHDEGGSSASASGTATVTSLV